MPQIEFRENKILKFTNLLSRKIPAGEHFSQGKQVVMLQSYLVSKSLHTMGPLIYYSTGLVGFNNDNNPIVDSRIMIQLKQDSVHIERPYKFDQLIRIENCLLARFSDITENFRFAAMKLQVFAYENDLELTGESYTVLIEQNGTNMLADIFMPVKGAKVEK